MRRGEVWTAAAGSGDAGMNRRELGQLFGRVRWSDGRPARYRDDPGALAVLLLSHGLTISVSIVGIWLDSLAVTLAAIVVGGLVGVAAHARLLAAIRRIERRDTDANEQYIPGTFIR